MTRHVRLMAILNVSPDSFSAPPEADPVAQGLRFLAEGADIIDVGGESTRPGALPVDPAEEQRRVLPVIRALAARGATISVDTRHADTMRVALEAGAGIVNDVSGLHHDPAALDLLAGQACRVVLMHMRGTPQTMQTRTGYTDVVSDVATELAATVARAQAAGIARARIVIDPGIGFAKTPAQSVALLQGLPDLARLGLPILVGASRKGFIGTFGGQPDVAGRLPGSLAAALFAVARGASILRVHDVAATRQALNMWQTLQP